MTIVRILNGYVGGWAPGDIVKDAPEGLIEIARDGVKNLATGELIAEIIEGDSNGSGDTSEREQQLQIELNESKNREAELLAQIAELQSKSDNGEADDEVKELKATAKELKIPGNTKMDAEELKKAISAAGGDGDGK
ncbi:hypothetical protein [Paenibacillus sp. FSL H8-0259]|uniref:hypothetical protein n=1 Tax=Paenibacillus sp. FSL H8-0259 TaxID=1920423 RepID=UPI00096D552C|nr:hypothetical protein [Paenibacillus sp. FSL H8-0259]OMF30956.1 hypothetical protein BK132_05870 [Paenibacillus sp. FSL H8-0259]